MRVLRIGAIVALLAAGVIARLALTASPAATPAIETTLDGISCGSPTRCIAVGFSDSSYGARVSLGAELTGGAWSVRLPPASPPTVDSLLSAVACRSPDACVAVGRVDAPAP